MSRRYLLARETRRGREEATFVLAKDPTNLEALVLLAEAATTPHELGLVPITTPAYSPQSNGLAEAFIGTFKRNDITGADLRDAETVLAQLAGWIEDYNLSSPSVH